MPTNSSIYMKFVKNSTITRALLRLERTMGGREGGRKGGREGGWGERGGRGGEGREGREGKDNSIVVSLV